MDVSATRFKLSNGTKLYVRSQWLHNTFILDASDGLRAWNISPSSETIEDRASQWDQSVSQYLADMRLYLGEQQPNSIYKFEIDDTGARFSWTLLRGTTTLEPRWRLREVANAKELNSQIMDILFDADTKIRDELKQKNKAFLAMKAEVEKSLKQNKRLAEEKAKYEDEVIKKFVVLLNSKKEKLREFGVVQETVSPSGRTSDDEQDEDLDDTEETDREDSGDEVSLTSTKRKASPPIVRGKEKMKRSSPSSPSSSRRKL